MTFECATAFATIDALHIAKSPEGRDKLQALGVIPIGGSVADFDTFIHREVEKHAKVVKAGGIRVE